MAAVEWMQGFPDRNWGQIMTGALLGAAPPLIIYAFLMDYYIAGLTSGATKG
jgi:multiple sugar transport system permease protein